jgi:RND family efflux transporter MFP subunit
LRAVRLVSARRLAPAVAGLTLLLSACGPSQPPQPPPLPVTVSRPLQKDIIEYDEYTGRFAAVESVEVRARVSGYLVKIAFKDGQMVKRGDQLFQIDPRPFQIALDQARADLQRAQAAAEFSERDLKRAAELRQARTLSEQVYDERLRTDRQARASLLQAQAAVRAAELNLEFTQIRAPVSGRAGRALVTEGNLVSGGTGDTTLLTTIVSLDPIYFYFDADEAAYLRYVRLSQTGERQSSRDFANPVRVSLGDESDYPHEGVMDFVDNVVDRGTGTVRGRALLNNPTLLFTPGQFGRLRLAATGKRAALLLPDEAIGTDQSRRYVLTVGEDGTVGQKPVEIGGIVEGMRVVRDGLTAQDWVVVKGVQRARPGGKVAPERTQIGAPTPAAAAPAAPAAGKAATP